MLTVVKCTSCGREYRLDTRRWQCDCHKPLQIEVSHEFEIAKVRTGIHSLWRYRDIFPYIRDENIVSFDEGFTPLVPVRIAGSEILVKQDQFMPSGSFKDRGASVLVSMLKQNRINTVVEDSSGNAGCALACYCARAGISCSIFVPEEMSRGKFQLLRLYGADVISISGGRDEVTKAALKTVLESNSYYASHVWNPFFYEGTKTIAYEIVEQLGWKFPDTVVVPAGNGTLLLGIFKGFKEFADLLGFRKIPRIVAVQAEHYSPLSRKFQNSLNAKVDYTPFKPTIAEGIAVTSPLRLGEMTQAINASHGSVITVSEDDIAEGCNSMMEKGYCIEPTSGAAVAGIKKYLNSRGTGPEIIVSVFTGNGLKSLENICTIKDAIQNRKRN